MSGKAKGAPASLEEEIALKRQVARELNEAAQNARDAARELTAAREQVAKGAEDAIQRVIDAQVNKTLEELGDYLRDEVEKVNTQIARVGTEASTALVQIDDVAKRTEARIAGYSDHNEVAAMISAGIKDAIADLSTEKIFIDDVAGAIAEYFEAVVNSRGVGIRRRG